MVTKYPVFYRDETVTDNYHGTVISDPYRYLEDLSDRRTVEFLDQQDALVHQYLFGNESRSRIKHLLVECSDYAKHSVPEKFGNLLYYWHNSGLQNHSILYRKELPNGEAVLLFNPNELSSAGTTSVSVSRFSHDGTYLAIGLSYKGSDWREICFFDPKTGKRFDDKLTDIRYSSVSWMKNETGVFYSKYLRNVGSEPEVALNQKLYYHALGTSQEDDILIYELPENPNYLLKGTVSDCGEWLVISVTEGCHNNAVYLGHIDSLLNKAGSPHPLFSKIEYDYNVYNFKYLNMSLNQLAETRIAQFD